MAREVELLDGQEADLHAVVVRAVGAQVVRHTAPNAMGDFELELRFLGQIFPLERTDLDEEPVPSLPSSGRCHTLASDLGTANDVVRFLGNVTDRGFEPIDQHDLDELVTLTVVATQVLAQPFGLARIEARRVLFPSLGILEPHDSAVELPDFRCDGVVWLWDSVLADGAFLGHCVRPHCRGTVDGLELSDSLLDVAHGASVKKPP